MDFGAVGYKQRKPTCLTVGQQSEIEPHATGESQNIAQKGESFDTVTFVHDVFLNSIIRKFVNS